MSCKTDAIEKIASTIENMAPGEAFTIEEPVAFAKLVRSLLEERDALREALRKIASAESWGLDDGSNMGNSYCVVS